MKMKILVSHNLNLPTCAMAVLAGGNKALTCLTAIVSVGGTALIGD
jgi:hypothetical protein